MFLNRSQYYTIEKRKTLTGQPGSSQSGLSCCHLDHANLNGLYYHLWQRDVHSWVVTKNLVTKSHIRVCGPPAVRSCVDVCCQWYSKSLHRCPGSGPQPVTIMLLSMWATLLYEAMVSFRLRLLPWAMSPSVDNNIQGLGRCPYLLLPLGANWMPGFWTTTWDHECLQGPCFYRDHT